jgi:sugar phosphate permease
MREDPSSPQINVSRMAVGGGIAGAIFALGSMAIFFVGIPILRYMFPAAFVLGCGVALILRFKRHETPGASWLLSATGKEAEAPAQRECKKGNPGRSAKVFLETQPLVDYLTAGS